MSADDVTQQRRNDFDREGDQLVFLIGPPRSGTTLLQRILGGHPTIHTVAEPWFLLHAIYGLRWSGIETEYKASLAREALRDFLDELPDGTSAYDAAIREMAAVLYGTALATSGKRLFLDKTPRYHYIIGDLNRVFPKAKFIFLLRNPLAVLSSVLDSWFDSSPDHLKSAVDHMSDLHQAWQNILVGIQEVGVRGITIRYEDLVADPSGTVNRICQHLEINRVAGLEEYGKNPVPTGRMGDTIGITRHSAPVTDSVDRWVNTLSKPDCYQFAKEYLDHLAKHELLTGLGYDASNLEARLDDAVLQRVAETGSDSGLLPPPRRRDLALEICAKAESAFEEQRLDDAVEGMVRALQIDPSCTRAASDLGAVLWMNAEPRLALQRFEQAFLSNPGDATAALNLADALAHTGREGDAKAVCMRSLQVNPDSQELLQLSCMLGDNSGPPLSLPTRLAVTPALFDEFTYSRRSHFAALTRHPEQANENIDLCNLKTYQDMLLYHFVLDNFQPGARLLEIGGGDSRVIRWLKDRYEFWNLDKLEGLGNGLTHLPGTDGFRLVRDYIGAFSRELPDEHFDGIFSLSTLEHVPEDDATMEAIYDDITRLLKPGGLSCHAFDILVRRQDIWFHKLIPWLYSRSIPLNKEAASWKIRADADAWGMSQAGYEELWQPVTKVPFEQFGVPMSYNVLWRKASAPVTRIPPATSTAGASAVAASPASRDDSGDGDKTRVPDTFCVLPWIHLQFNPEGSVKLCCRAFESLRDAQGAVLTPYGQTLDQIWNSDEIQQIRRDMMAGRRPSTCALCFEQEDRADVSYRMFSNHRWSQTLGTTPAALVERIRGKGEERGLELSFLQLNLGNLCNLKCRMCSTSHSSQIEKDPIHSRWLPRNPANVVGLALPSDDASYRFDVQDRPGLAFAGFHPPEHHEGIPCRWTDGHGRLTIGIDFPARPKTVRLQLLVYRPIASHGTTPLSQRIRINGREVFSGELARSLAQLEFALPNDLAERHLAIELLGPTYERQGRTVGIGLVRIEVETDPTPRINRAIPLVSRLRPGVAWNDSDEFVFNELLADTSSLRELYFTGGEPFINHQVERILAKLIERGDHERMVLQFNSNLTAIDDHQLDMLRRFPKVNLAASIDAMGAHYEYLRYPAKWDRVSANLARVIALDNVHVTFVPIISAYNIMNIVELCRYSDRIGADFSLFDLGGPSYIDLHVLTPSARRLAAQRLRDYAAAECAVSRRPTVLRMADRLDRETFQAGELRTFMEFTNDLDSRRRFDFRVQHAELCSLMALDGHPWEDRTRHAA